MFARPRAKAKLAPPSKKRKREAAIEEITFDHSAREDYLTGFHKRKLQRIKHAKEDAAKREREDKLTVRKKLRENRKANLEKHVKEVNSLLRKQAGVISESSEDENGDGNVSERPDDVPAEVIFDQEDAYVDDDRFTTVTVEAVDVSKDGLQKVRADRGQDSDASEVEEPEENPIAASVGQVADSGKVKRTWSKDSPRGAKKKKKRFRYESKAERKVTRFKERSGNKARAKERKSK